MEVKILFNSCSLNMHGQVTAFSHSILFFQHPLEIDFGLSGALNKDE